MFDEISPRYDLLNRLLSFGLDVSWRRQLAGFLKGQDGQRVLDVATGTADVLLALLKYNPAVRSGFGIDMADKMLDIGRKKISRSGFDSRILLQHGDANHIPFNDHSFDAVTIAFGIRNMEEPGRVLREMGRVLNPGGRALVLEFSMPRNRGLRAAHLLYLRHAVPALGGVISGNSKAYRYLNQTIETFPCGDDFRALMESGGFKNVTAHPLMGGIATIYCGEKA